MSGEEEYEYGDDDAAHMVTIPALISFGPPIYLDYGTNREIDLTIGTEVVHPNALDLLDAVITAALAIDPERAAETLAEAAESLPCQCRGCRAQRFADQPPRVDTVLALPTQCSDMTGTHFDGCDCGGED